MSPARSGEEGRGDWQTPPALFAQLNRIWRFDYDAFASHENALCDHYSTSEATFRANSAIHRLGMVYLKLADCDGLTESWANRRVFGNPPYGRDFLPKAIEKAVEERENAAVIVYLIPAATETLWFKQVADTAQKVYLLTRRVRFINPETGKPGGSPPHGHAIAVWHPEIVVP